MLSKSEKAMKLHAEEQRKEYLRRKREATAQEQRRSHIGFCSNCGSSTRKIDLSEWPDLKSDGFDPSKFRHKVEIDICEDKQCESVVLDKGEFRKIMDAIRQKSLLEKIF